MPHGLVTYSDSGDGEDDDVDANHQGPPGQDVGLRVSDPDQPNQPAKPKQAE